MTPAQFLEFLVSVSIQSAIVVGVTHWLCQIVASPRLQCRLWNLCHVLILVLVVCGMALPHFRVLNPWQALPPIVIEQVVATETMLGQAALGIWLAGTSLSLILLIREWRRAFRFLNSCRIANAAETLLVTPSPESDHETLDQPVQLLMSNHLGSPFCCQWHHPLLVIPEFMLDMRPEEIQYVARHELEHLRSGHPLQLFVQRVVATVFWFHPVVWWASRQSSLAREFACDDAAVTAQRDVVAYLKVLVAIAERGRTQEAEGAALFFSRGAGILALRGRRLLNRLESNSWSPTISERLWWPQTVLVLLTLAAWCFWTPLDALASTRTRWSPWPRWSASFLHTLEISARDFEPYDTRTRLHEMSERSAHSESQRAE